MSWNRARVRSRPDHGRASPGEWAGIIESWLRTVLQPPEPREPTSIGDGWLPSVAPAAIVCAAALALSAVLLALPITFGFSLDGQRVLDERLPMTWDHLLKPFHSHLNLVPIAIWDRMAAVFGTASSTPFLALLLATHVALSTLTAAALSRRVGPIYAVALGLPLALLGSADFDLVAPWQILFTITLLAGLGAVVASIDRERTIARRIAVATCLVIAVLTSNVAEFIILALFLWHWLDDRRAQMIELAPAVLVFGAWFIAYGRAGLTSDTSPFTLRAVLSIAPYTALAIASGVGGMIGLGTLAGAFASGALAARFRPPRPMLAFLIAIVAMFAVGALFRSFSRADQAMTSRYIYLVAYMVAFGIIAAAYRPPFRPALALGLSVVAVVGNLVMLARALPGYLAPR
jgi:hypothetical protein